MSAGSTRHGGELREITLATAPLLTHDARLLPGSRHDTHALVIADDRDDRDSHRAHFALYKNFGTPGEYMSTRLDRLLDTVYFAPSHPSRLLQAADMLAYTYRRWNAQTEPDPRSQLTMDRLRGKITSSGKLHSPGNWP